MGGSCTCENGHTLLQKVAADTWVPNGCLAEQWAQALNLGLNDELWEVWEEACSSHSKCYVDCSKSKEECDSEYKDNMKAACSNEFESCKRGSWWLTWKCWFRKRLCKGASEVLYKAIRGGDLGGPTYRLGRQDYCECGGPPVRRLDIVV